MYEKVECILKGCQLLSLMSILTSEEVGISNLSFPEERILGRYLIWFEDLLFLWDWGHWSYLILRESLMSLLIHCDKQCAPSPRPQSDTHLLLQGTTTARTSPSNAKQEEEVQSSLLGCPDQTVEKSPTFLGPPQTASAGQGSWGVCAVFLVPSLRGLAFTGWKGRVWMRCMFFWLCCLFRQGMEYLLQPMGSTPLDGLLGDWFQALEPSENLDGDQKGVQVVSSAEIRWSRVRGIWRIEITIKVGFKIVAQEQRREIG